METQLEQLILDFHERMLPAVWRRLLSIPLLPHKASILVGMRRTGKTWLLYQVMQSLLEQGVPKQALVYINFEDERLLPFRTEDFQKLLNIFYRLYPQFQDKTVYFFLDEIQNIVGWERFIRRLLDTENCQIFVTGSSAKLLSREIATSLRGRSLSTEVFPLSFREYLSFAKIPFNKTPGAKNRALIEHAWKHYLQWGGFPEIQTIEDVLLRNRVLQEYVNGVIFRDVAERYHIREMESLRYLIRHFLHAPATLFSVNKFYNDLKSQQITCSKNSLHALFGYLEDSYLIYPVYKFHTSLRVQRVNPKKTYAIDVGLLQAFNVFQPEFSSHLLENFVYMELRRRSQPIFYYHTSDGHEVDFLVQTSHTLQLIQVSQTVENKVTFDREMHALQTAMRDLKLREGFIITAFDERTIDTPEGTVRILPAWKWSLQD